MGLTIDSTLDFAELAATPGAPAAGVTRLYSKTTGGLFVQSSVLAETQLMPISQRGPATWFTTETGAPVSPSTSTSPLYGDPVYVGDYVVRKSDMEVFLVGGTQAALTLTDQSYTLGTGVAPNLVASTIARAYPSANVTVSGNNVAVKVALNTTSFDPGSNFSTANNRYTAPIAGWYSVEAAIYFASQTVAGPTQTFIYKNGAQVSQSTETVGTGGYWDLSIVDVIQLNAGDYIELWVVYNGSGGNDTLEAGSTATWMNVSLKAPLTSAPVQPNTGGRAYRNAAYTMPTGWNVVPIDTVAAGDDPGGHMNVTSSRYVVTTPGLYDCTGSVIQAMTAGAFANIGIYKNGVLAAIGDDVTNEAASGTNVAFVVDDKIRCVAGDYLDLRIYNSAQAALNTGEAYQNYLSVVKVDQTSPSPANTGWFTPVLGSGVTENVTVQYMKDANGFVHLRGSCTLAATAEALFTLPAGFRPGIGDFYGGVLTTAGAAGAYIYIYTTGVISADVPAANDTLYLSGVAPFLAEN